jgi:hypothetical protein
LQRGVRLLGDVARMAVRDAFAFRIQFGLRRSPWVVLSCRSPEMTVATTLRIGTQNSSDRPSQVLVVGITSN